MAIDAITAKLFDGALHQSIRDRFSHMDTDGRIYLESAGGSLKLKAALTASAEVAAWPDNAGRISGASKKLGAILTQGEADVRTFLNGVDGVVVSGESVTANVFRIVETVLAASAAGRGNVVTSQLEHPCTYSATKYHAKKLGMAWRVAEVKPMTGELPIEHVLNHVDGDTVAVVLVHASNVLGTRIDAKAIAAAVRERNPRTLVLLDGTQHAPHASVDVADLGVDAYFFAPYKTFSTVGVCFVWLGERMADLEHERLNGTAGRNWNLGTRDGGGYAAWSAVVDYLAWLGGEVGASVMNRRERVAAAMTTIEAHEAALTQHAIDGMSRIEGLKLFGIPHGDERRDAVLSFAIDHLPADEIVTRMAAMKIAVHDRKHDAYCGHILKAVGAPNVVRMSLAHYNTVSEVDAFLEVLRQIRRA